MSKSYTLPSLFFYPFLKELKTQHYHQLPKPKRTKSTHSYKINSKSTLFLTHHLSHKSGDNHHPSPTELRGPTPHKERMTLIKLSLVRKRIPQSLGSIQAQSSSDSYVGSSLPPVHTLFRSCDKEDIIKIQCKFILGLFCPFIFLFLIQDFKAHKSLTNS